MLELKIFTVSNSTFEKNCVKNFHNSHVLCSSCAGLVQKLCDNNNFNALFAPLIVLYADYVKPLPKLFADKSVKK